MKTRPPFFRASLPLALFLLLLLFAACGSAITGPSWANDSGGKPTLTGDWIGEITLAGGIPAHLFLHLEVPPVIDGPNLTGTARHCIGDERGEYDVWGDADNEGQVDDLRIRAEEDAPLWLLHDLSAAWQGDELTLTGTYSYDPTRQHIARSDQPEPALAMTMRRGVVEDFENRCAGQ